MEWYGPPDWMARVGKQITKEAIIEDSPDKEAYILGLAWAQIVATKELEKVTAGHGI